jgi:transcriptional regulator with XRE-family HTH domain
MSTKKWYGIEDLEKKYGTMTLGRFVKAFREADEISQTAYAKKLGISRANLCDIEKGRKPVSLERAAKIAKAIGVSEITLVQLALQDQLRREKLPYKVELKSA